MSKASVLRRKNGVATVFTELKILSMVNCPFICNCHYAFQDENYLYLVLDLASGGDLRYNLSIAPNQRFSEERAKFYICQIMLAVQYCHSMNILHRDIKPENILLTQSGYIKLTDFGISKLLQNINDCRSSSGTHGYMAPEIYIAPNYIHGPASDWWSVGILLHEFVTGSRPFESKRIKACQRCLADLPLYLLENGALHIHITRACKSFITELLRIDPMKRLGSGSGKRTVFQHRWIREYDFFSLSKHKIPAPFIPDKQAALLMNRENQKELENLLKEHLVTPPLSLEQQELFAKYSFRNKKYGIHDYMNAKSIKNALHKFPASNLPTESAPSSQPSNNATSLPATNRTKDGGGERERERIDSSSALLINTEFMNVLNGMCGLDLFLSKGGGGDVECLGESSGIERVPAANQKMSRHAIISSASVVTESSPFRQLHDLEEVTYQDPASAQKIIHHVN